jgi:choline kinase
VTMRAILLAAGRASRLRPLTDHTPKCLLPVGGRTLLSRAIASLAEHGLRRITIVDGFEGGQIRAAVRAEFPTAWFTFVRNDDWATTNNAASLLLARYDGDEPMLLLDSDIVFEPAVLTRLLEAVAPNRLALRTRGHIGEEEIKVTLAVDGRVSDIGKEIAPSAAAGESVGLEVFSGGFAARLFATLERRVAREGRVNEWYEAAFLARIRAGEAIYPVDLGDLACMEIDTMEDLARARASFE